MLCWAWETTGTVSRDCVLAPVPSWTGWLFAATSKPEVGLVVWVGIYIFTYFWKTLVAHFRQPLHHTDDKKARMLRSYWMENVADSAVEYKRTLIFHKKLSWTCAWWFVLSWESSGALPPSDEISERRDLRDRERNFIYLRRVRKYWATKPDVYSVMHSLLPVFSMDYWEMFELMESSDMLPPKTISGIHSVDFYCLVKTFVFHFLVFI